MQPESIKTPLSSNERRHFQANVNSDEIDLSLVVKFILRNWKILFVMTIVGLACSILLYMALPAKWRANAILKIGSLPDSALQSSNLKHIYIEDPSELVERVTQSDTLEKVIETIKRSEGVKTITIDEISLIHDSLKAKNIKNTGLIDLTVSGFSAKMAEEALTATTRVLMETHQLRFSAVLERFKEKMTGYNKQIESLNNEILSLQSMLAKSSDSKLATQLDTKIVLVQLLAYKKTELNELMQQRNELQDQMTSINIYPTTLTNRVRAEKLPYFPILSLFLLVGGFSGFLIGLALIFFRNLEGVSSSA